MAKPFLRYLPAKLKPIAAPAVSIPLTIFTLLSILLWEYYQNPDWFERDLITNANPESALTPDEQAKLAEIDTVDLLLEGAQVSGPLSTLESLDASSEAAESGNLSSNLDINIANGSRRLADQSDPFGAYTAEYEFPGSSRATIDLPERSFTPSLANSTTPTTSSSVGAPQETNSSVAQSAFSNAISQQQAIRANEVRRDSEPASNQLAAPLPNTPQPNSLSNSIESTSSQNDNRLVQPAGQPSVPFIRTTPAMSPPAGTTGYQTPATSSLPTFNLAPPQTTSSSLTTPVSPNSGTFAPGQIGTVQAPPIARPIQSSPASPNGTIYTAPSSTQPTQNRRAR